MGRMLFGLLAMALLAVSSGAVEKRSESYMKDLEGQQVRRTCNCSITRVVLSTAAETG
jgi:hypothetical protein